MTTDRAAYISGLRKLADHLEANHALPLPYNGSASALSVFVRTKAEAVAYARLMGKAEKSFTDSTAYGFNLTGTIDGLNVLVYAPREEVCTRVVTGTREVVTEVPDPEALAAVPTILRTEVVEDVTWECSPLLSEAARPVTT